MDEERPTVYLETTIPSYLVSEPSRDVVIAGHQLITHEWWKTAKERFYLLVSTVVREEAAAGDALLSERRSSLLSEIDAIEFSPEVYYLSELYEKELGLTGKAIQDIPHFAFAVAYNVDYLVTWNCSHIANCQVIRRLLIVNQRIGRPTPLVVTPEELLDFPRGRCDYGT